MRKLAEAMHYAHRRHIIHRDLKPANVLLQKSDVPDLRTRLRVFELAAAAASDRELRTWDCIPKITDFGLAKQLDAEFGQTASGVIVGSPSYMAPEQANTVFGEIGPAADVYALGAILYELLTGRPPHKAGDTNGHIASRACRRPRAAVAFPFDVPRDLNTICMKCLQKEPHKRYRARWPWARTWIASSSTDRSTPGETRPQNDSGDGAGATLSWPS